jgi:hypothetical protein
MPQTLLQALFSAAAVFAQVYSHRYVVRIAAIPENVFLPFLGQGLENDEGAILVMQGDGNLVRRPGKKSSPYLSNMFRCYIMMVAQCGIPVSIPLLVLFYALTTIRYMGTPRCLVQCSD